MILDERTEFADATSIAAFTVGTTLLGDTVDIRNLTAASGGASPNLTTAVTRGLAQGTPLYLVISVDTAVVAAGAGTIQYRLCSDDNTSLSSPTVHFASQAFTTANTAGGSAANFTSVGSVPVCIPLPAGMYERHLGVQVVVAGNNLSAGAVSAFLTFDPQLWRAYADNVPGTV